MLRPVPAVLLALLLSGTAGRAYTCNSLIGNLDCGRGSSRQVGAATGRTEGHSREAESELPRHHRREYPWCSVGGAGYHGIVDFRAMNNVYRPSEVWAVYVVEIRHIADRRGTQRMSAFDAVDGSSTGTRVP
jgi:hypothetical protein